MAGDDAVPGIILTGRRVLAQYQLDRVNIEDRVVTETAGGVSETWVPRTHLDEDPDSETFGEMVPTWTKCRFGQVTGFGKITDKEPILVLDAVIQEKRSQAIQFGIDVEIEEQDRIVQPDGKVWVMVADLTPNSVMRLMRRVVVREL